jgi:hypothetical protein
MPSTASALVSLSLQNEGCCYISCLT